MQFILEIRVTFYYYIGMENTELSQPALGPNAEFGAALDAAMPAEPVSKPAEPAAPVAAAPVPADNHEPLPDHQQNSRNAARRIQQKKQFRIMQSRIEELESKLAGFQGKDDPESQAAAAQIGERIADMQAVSSDHEYNDFQERAIDAFGEQEAVQFMRQTQKYAPHVNKNEPELCAYIDRPYGQILLSEWYKRMDKPGTRAEWLSMTSFEKGKTLDTFYKQINTIVNGKPAAPKANAPVPGSGRNAGGLVPSDDFGIALQAAVNRRKH